MTPRRVIVIDDHQSLRELLAELLEDEGYRALTCSTQDAVAVLRRERPDLIILDLVLDIGLDSWALYRELSCDPAIAPIPIIVSTLLRRSSIGVPADVPPPAAVLPWIFDISELLRTVEDIFEV